MREARARTPRGSALRDAAGPRLGAALQVHEPEAERWHELHRESSARIWVAFARAGVALIDAVGKDGPACGCVHRQNPKGPERVKLKRLLRSVSDRSNSISGRERQV
jgi:hypothetical protein